VLALTWDDGPDTGTLALAEYLRRRKVSATFFVVKEWVKGVSSDPGFGPNVYATGYAKIPILGALVSLGHRIGNHTRHHTLLTSLTPAEAAAEVRENQEALEPFIKNDLRLFRAPGGAWSEAPQAAIAGDPALAKLVGPVRWDIDRKDWEDSIRCDSPDPRHDCEPASVPQRSHTKPDVVARRYLESIDEAKHGIVLLHDRVGHVGSTYALDLARVLVPALEARGYVFAAPVLAFSALAARPDVAPARGQVATGAAAAALPGVDARTLRTGDLNGDGRPDVCGLGALGVSCALATPDGFAAASSWLQRGMTDHDGWRAASPDQIASIRLADVNADGRADLCFDAPLGAQCALAP
jgi:peptidoglycan/xylan/chitin deacetylase (PgdA/CDA1 family)